MKRRSAFDGPEWIFELKYDGFRALAVIEDGRSQLISRNGHPFASFADLAQDIGAAVPNTKLIVLDGEIVCVDMEGQAAPDRSKAGKSGDRVYNPVPHEGFRRGNSL